MASTPKKAVKKTAPRTAPKVVAEAEFRSFQKETREGFGTILDALDKITANMGTPAASVETTEAAPDTRIEVTDEQASEAETEEAMSFLPLQYARVFRKYFDEDDGFTARLSFPTVDAKGSESGGITFTIVVPEKFSNVSEAHKALYKVDLRTRALQPHNIAKGIEDWCAIVAKNLKYDRNIKTK